MESAAIEVIEVLSEKLGIAVDWAGENVLPVAEELIQRYITYTIVSMTTQLIVSFVAMVALSVTILYCASKYAEIVKKNRTRYYDYNNDAVKFVVIEIISSVLVVFAGIWFGASIFGLVKVIYFPEACILDLITSIK